MVRWFGFGPEDDEWLPYSMVEDCEALDDWYAKGGDGPENASSLKIKINSQNLGKSGL